MEHAGERARLIYGNGQIEHRTLRDCYASVEGARMELLGTRREIAMRVWLDLDPDLSASAGMAVYLERAAA